MNDETFLGYCICDEEFCYCLNLVDLPADRPGAFVACDECEHGFHVWEPGGERDHGALEWPERPQ